jgi:hypothetical protein
MAGIEHALDGKSFPEFLEWTLQKYMSPNIKLAFFPQTPDLAF